MDNWRSDVSAQFRIRRERLEAAIEESDVPVPGTNDPDYSHGKIHPNSTVGN